MQDMNQTAARRLARYALETRWATLPEAVRRESQRAMLNWVACAVGGAETPSVEAAVKGALALNPDGGNPMLARAELTGIADAAMVMCLSSSAHTFDDTHLETITHPTGPVAAAALSVAHSLAVEGRPVSGQEFLTALALGIEIECRVSKALVAGGSHIGWYMTGLSGGIGAAVAVAHLLGLSEDQVSAAIGLATTQACGLRATHGSMAIALVPGLAARNGVAAAYLARAGLTCNDFLIEGRNGLLEVIADSEEAPLIVQDLGSDFEMMRNAYKPYPCGIVIHPSIDACLQLAANPDVDVDRVREIVLQVHPDAMRLCWRKLPETELDAQVSVYHWVGASLVHGKAGLEEGSLACVLDPRVRALQERVSIKIDERLADNQAVATVILEDGRSVEAVVDNATGSRTNPMSDEQLAAKLRDLCTPVLGSRATEDLLRFCLQMSETADVAAIFALCRRSEAGSV